MIDHTLIHISRIKMPCLSVKESNLIELYRKVGHIQYFLLYKNQPYMFRFAADPAFYEAIGDAMVLFIPTHLRALGLIDELHDDKGNHYLMKRE